MLKRSFMVRVKVCCETEEKRLNLSQSRDNRRRQGGAQREMAYRFDAGQHADVSGEVCGLENGLIVPPEVQVHHQRLQLLGNDPRLILHVPAVRTAGPSVDILTTHKTC